MNANNGELLDRISQGKNLLKKYQSKHRTTKSSSTLSSYCDGDGVSVCSTTKSTGALKNNEDSCDESTATFPDGSRSSRESSRPPSFSHDRSNNKEESVSNLQKLLHEKQEMLNEALQKLQSLNVHYSELHKAYSQMCEVQNAKIGVPAEFANQINQLNIALNISIAEKTQLQSELRNLQAKMSALELEYRSMEDSTKALRTNSSSSLSSLAELEKEKSRFLETIRNQAQEIEKYHKENSQLEAKMLIMQQDKQDMQARFRHFIDEKNALEKELGVIRNDLMMKEIYIKQLSDNTPLGSTAYEEMKTKIQSLNDTIEKLKISEEKNTRLTNEFNVQMAEERQRNEKMVNEQRQIIETLQKEVDGLKIKKKELESSKNFLEEELNVLRKKYSDFIEANSKKPKDASDDFQNQSTACNNMDFEKLKDKVKYFEKLYAQYTEEVNEMHKKAEQKDSQIENLQSALFESMQNVQRLENERKTNNFIDENVHSLAEQLQNEKATVSRAVSQNQQLKQQLIELQERIIQVSNESASKEDERVSSLLTIKRLQQQIDEMKTHTNQFKSPSATKQEGTQTNMPTSSFYNNLKQVDESDYKPILSSPKSMVNEQEGHNNEQRQVGNGNDEIKKGESINLPATQPPITEQPHLHEDVNDVETPHLNNISDNIENEEETQRCSHNELVPIPNTSSDMQNLIERIETMAEENRQFRMTNDRLQYWLTALESENESIGEYIALYRFQRTKIQQQLSEKERLLSDLQQEKSLLWTSLFEIKRELQNFIGSEGDVKTEITNTPVGAEIEKGSEVMECAVNLSENNEQNETNNLEGTNVPTTPMSDSPDQKLMNLLERCNMVFSNLQKPCPTTSGDKDVYCAGCVECRGDIMNL